MDVLTDRATLIYDMDCGFCTRSAKWIEGHWSGADRPQLVGGQMLDDATISAHGITRERLSLEVVWVERDGVLGGADAIAASLKAAAGWVHLLGVLISLPGMAQVGRLVYPQVAKHRHQMPGGTDACKLD
jgi:predicted DCC family thiol-disulfide oxidoreductase YuxK